MSSKPKKQDYQASEAEKTQASVAKAEKDYFNQTYAPLLREMRDTSMQEDLGWCSRVESQVQTPCKPLQVPGQLYQVVKISR